MVTFEPLTNCIDWFIINKTGLRKEKRKINFQVTVTIYTGLSALLSRFMVKVSFILPDVCLVAKEVSVEDEVDCDLLFCCRRDLIVGSVPLLLLLCEQRESLLSDFTNLNHPEK